MSYRNIKPFTKVQTTVYASSMIIYVGIMIALAVTVFQSCVL